MAPSTRNAPVSRPGRLPRPKIQTAGIGPNRPNMTAHTPLDTPSARALARPSGLPRAAVNKSSNVVADVPRSSRLTPTPDPEMQSEYSSMSQDVPLLFDSAPPPRMRDRPPSRQRPGRAYDASTGARSSLDMDNEAVLGIVMPEKRLPPLPTLLPPRLIPELQALAATSIRLAEPTRKSVSSISSPSTRLTESPAPWSASTVTTTPTSWSSVSPGIVQPVRLKTAGQKSQTVPLPSVRRQRLPKLPPVKDSRSPWLPSDPLPTAPRDPDRGRVRSEKKTPLNTPAPTPPPRTSSAKRLPSRNSSKSSRERGNRSGPEPALSALEQEYSPLAGRGRTNVEQVGESIRRDNLVNAHDDLQKSLTALPRRPSRSGTTDLNIAELILVDNTLPSRSISRSRDQYPSRTGNVAQPGYVQPSVQGGRGQQFVSDDPRIGVPESPSRFGKLSRLGLFSRRAKSPSSDTSKSSRKLQRKGPAAGTGHEGYGKYARRGRKTSYDSTPTHSESERSVSSTRRIPMLRSTRQESRSSSRHNRSSQSDLDEFVAPRLKPVVIIGGSGTGVSNDPRGRLAGQSSMSTPEVATQTDTFESFSEDSERWAEDRTSQVSSDVNALWAAGNAPNQPDMPSLALRRSQRFGSDVDSFRLPTPIRTESLSVPVYINSYDTSQSSGIPASVTTSSTANDIHRVDPSLLKSPEKKTRRLRWNPFRRRNPSRDSQKAVSVSAASPLPGKLAVSVSTVPVPRSMPYYAMMDSESEVNNTMQIGEVLTQAVESPAPSPTRAAMPSGDEDAGAAAVDLAWGSGYDESLLPDPQTLPPYPFQQSRSELVPDPISSTQRQQRQPRLAQVGRIPKVVSSRSEREHKPSRTSFSQPFVRTASDTDEVYPNRGVSSGDSIPRPLNAERLPNRPFAAEDRDGSVSAVSEFLEFPPKDTSEVSASSSSEGPERTLAPALVPTSAPIGSYEGRMDKPGDPDEDEVWNEYDDFIDHVMSPSKVRNKKAGSSPSTAMSTRAAASDLLAPTTRTQQPSQRPARSERAIHDTKRPALDLSFAPTSLIPPVTERMTGEDVHLRRSRIAAALHSSMDASSPFSMREFLHEYETRPRDSAKLSEPLSTSPAGQPGQTSTVSPVPELESTNPSREPSHQENAAFLDVVERVKDPVAQSELHYASLMVAKWLSFGRVLFSPAHDEIQTLTERHILVIDGLGNEDWSIYCAVTYEAQRAFVHDLKERSSLGMLQAPRSSQHAPENYRRTDIVSFYERFPFPQAFFSAVVFRFPPAMAEDKMKNIISECRRVLVPGGYLELMLLDLDIVNMGVHTRRAVRELKLRISATDREVSLKPIIDNVQSVLGSCGFSNISRCVVGVPVGGRPPGSVDSSSSSPSSRGSGGTRASAETRPPRPSVGVTLGQSRGTNFSLNDLVADHSENADAKIGKIVARTARTWWQHCFEATVITDGNLARSIFADKTVLSECKRRGSSFKLLIAYAQRPVFETRRRTMSEPVMSTPATAGVQRPQ